VSNNFHIERFAKYYKQKKKYTYLRGLSGGK
jgi:hypothetical protein